MIKRIILIGNGFDLAHGMKTAYRNFINDYWTSTLEDYLNCTEGVFNCDKFLYYCKN